MKNRNFAVLLFSVMMLCVSVCLSAGEKSLDDGHKVIRVPDAAGLLDATVFSPDVNVALIKGEKRVLAVSGLFEIEKMKFTLLPLDLSGDVSCRALSADAQMAAVGSADGITLGWRKDQKEKMQIKKFYEGGKVSSLAFSVDGEALAAGTTDGKVVLWDVLALKRDNVAQQFPKPPERHTAIVTCLGFSPNNRFLIAGYEDGSVRLWDTQTRKLLRPFNKLEERGSIRCFSFSADSKELAIGTSEGIVGFWDSGSTSKGTWRVFKDSKSVSVSSVSICGKDNQIVVAVGGQSGQVKRLFNVKNGERKLRPISTSTLSNVVGLRFSKDGEKLVTLHRDREVRAWHPSDFDLEVSPHPTVALVGSAWPRVDGPQIAFLDDFVRPIRDDFGGSDRSRGFDRQSILRGTIRGLVGVREVHVHGSKSVVQATLDGDTFEAKLPLRSLVGGVTVTAVGDNEKSVSKQYQPYDRRGKDHALLIGVSEYLNFSGAYSAEKRPDLQLDNAKHDMEALDEVLKKEYGFVTRSVPNPTSREIEIEIENFVKADYPEDAQLLIFYAGHGIILDDKTSHIFGSDTAAPQPLLEDESLWRGDKKEVFEFKQQTYELVNLKSLIARNAHNVLVILDACNSGTIDDALAAGDSLPDPPDLRDNSQASFKEKLLSRTQQYLTSASKEDAKDAGYKNKDNSPFTDQLVNALRENASAGTILTFSELWEYFRKNRFHKDQKNAEQTPQNGVLSNRHEKDGDFLFIPPHRL